jgi:beta-lactamase superfamily II metal-dependent hydrolase
MTYEVGQTLLRRDVNERSRNGPEEVTVTKVGRKLVTVARRGGRTETFRIEDGTANDRFGHGWLQTRERYEAEQERGTVIQRLRDLGVSLEYTAPTYPTDALRDVADVLAAARPRLDTVPTSGVTSQS